jgi:tetraacyldisaccharide 4'-kinase
LLDPASTAPQRADQRLARRGGVVELLRVPAALFAGLVRARGALYDRGLLPIQRLEVPVVSIGNLTAGGTGKTPMVEWVARELRESARRPGILSRGYGREGDALNDEGQLLAELLPDVPHVQNADRVEGGRELEGQGVQSIVLDDGFQHRRLHRDVDLVLVDATRPWGLAPPPNGGDPVRAFLPRGLLREGPTALGRAHAVVISRCEDVTPTELEALRARIESSAPGCPIAEATHSPQALRVLPNGEERSLETLRGQTVDLVSAIGNPEAFERTVRGLGAEIGTHRVFSDHYTYTASDLAGLTGSVVTTAKDAVKLKAIGREILVLDIALTFRTGESVVRALLDALPLARSAREQAAMHEGLHG